MLKINNISMFFYKKIINYKKIFFYLDSIKKNGSF